MARSVHNDTCTLQHAYKHRCHQHPLLDTKVHTKLLRGHSRLHVQQRLASDCAGGKQIGAFKVLWASEFLLRIHFLSLLGFVCVIAFFIRKTKAWKRKLASGNKALCIYLFWRFDPWISRAHKSMQHQGNGHFQMQVRNCQGAVRASIGASAQMWQSGCIHSQMAATRLK